MGDHNSKGKEGERLASLYLEQKGYVILEKNWRFGKEEIDLIARKKDTLIVIEVKCRSGFFFGQPEEFVSHKKQKHLIKAADAYIQKKGWDMNVRFDVIGIILTGNSYHINHIEDAFRPIA